MDAKEEYKELFRAEALENYEELNRLFSQLEKHPEDRPAIEAVFRITHTLKGNAMGMGFAHIAQLSHLLEDIFGLIKQGKARLDRALFDALFRANDKLGELIASLSTGASVSYRGIQTKLQVYLRQWEAAEATATAALAPEKVPNVVSPSEVKGVAAASDAGPDEERLAEASAATLPTRKAPRTRRKAPAAVPDDAATPEPTPDPAAHEEEGYRMGFSDVVQVPVRKLDSLLNLVGELLIERDRLAAQFAGRGNQLARLQRITSDLQYGVMSIRMVQVGFMFNKFHRIVRDVAVLEQKEVRLVLEGTGIEIDRNILKIISDSLIHVVRNAVSHGIESPAARQAAGKSVGGTITLRARNEKDTVYIEVSDDGAGIRPDVIRRKAIEKSLLTAAEAAQLSDEEVLECIFAPGFSSAEKVTAVSGRGVGMDVVKRATESIGGRVQVGSVPGAGTTITLALPSSMAVKGALLFELEGQEFTIPLTYTEAVVSLRKQNIHKVGKGLAATYLDKNISVVFLRDLFALPDLSQVGQEGVLHTTFDALPDAHKLDLVIVSHARRSVGFVVDRLLQQKEIVEKTLGQPLDHLDLISGATILGNGNVCLVLDVPAILQALFRTRHKTLLSA